MNRQQILHGLVDLFSYKAGYQSESSGLRLQDMQLLERVGFNGATQTLELARICNLAPATAIAVLDRLESAGYVRRVRDQNNRRVVMVHLTTAGQELLERHTAEDQAFIDNLLDALPTRESAALEKLLAKALAVISLETLFDPRPEVPSTTAAKTEGR